MKKARVIEFACDSGGEVEYMRSSRQPALDDPLRGISQIAGIRGAGVLAAYDVINLMGKARAILVNPAVLAAVTGSFGDRPAPGFGDVMSHCSGFDGRAPLPCV